MKRQKLEFLVVSDHGWKGYVRRWHARKAALRMLETASEARNMEAMVFHVSAVLKAAGYACEPREVARKCGLVMVGSTGDRKLLGMTLRHMT